jgi:NADH:ubiquinone oxidoreductase subunit 5 (subunit L)/multisubunit Na+/H+ antiporter MnhA subunit
MPMLPNLWIVLALPLLGAAVNGLLGRHWSRRTVNSVAIGAAALAFVSAVELVREFFGLDPASIPWVRCRWTNSP